MCFTFRTGSAEQQTPERGAELGEGPGEAVGQNRPAFPCLPRSHLKEATTLASTRQGAGPFLWRWTGIGGEDGQQGKDEHTFTYCQWMQMCVAVRPYTQVHISTVYEQPGAMLSICAGKIYN